MAMYAHLVHTYREMFVMLINRTIEAFERRSEIKFGSVRVSKVAYQRMYCVFSNENNWTDICIHWYYSIASRN